MTANHTLWLIKREHCPSSEHLNWCHEPGWTSKPERRGAWKIYRKQRTATVEGRSGQRPEGCTNAVPASGTKPERECREDPGGREAGDCGERVRTHRRVLAVSPPGRSAAPSEATLASSLQKSSGREVRTHRKGAGVGSASAQAQCRGAGRPGAARHRTIAELLRLRSSVRLRAALTSTH